MPKATQIRIMMDPDSFGNWRIMLASSWEIAASSMMKLLKRGGDAFVSVAVEFVLGIPHLDVIKPLAGHGGGDFESRAKLLESTAYGVWG